MKLLKSLIFPMLLLLLPVLAAGLLLDSAYTEVKKRAIDHLNNQQMVMAETASRGIESFIKHHTELLTRLSQLDQIISLDERGRELMRITYRTHEDEFRGITRVSASGHVMYSFPETPGMFEADLSSREHIKEIMSTHQPVVSDVFESVQGFMIISYHVPVFKEGVFHGSLAVLLPFDELSRNYLEPIRIGKDGYAWMISNTGIELHCPVPGHVGKSVFDNCRDFPTILSMAREMVKGGRGTTNYYFDRVRDEAIESLRKQAAYVPVKVGNTFWSIVVATPEDEALGSIEGFRDRWLLIIGVLMLAVGVWTSYVFSAFKIVKEEEKRKRAEEKLKESESRYRTFFEQGMDGIVVINPETGEFSEYNDRVCQQLGFSREEFAGLRLRDIEAIENAEEIEGHVQKIMSLGFDRFETRQRKKDGEIRYVEVLAQAMEVGGQSVCHCVWRDITERRQAEEAIRQSEQRYRAIFENTGTATVILHEDTTILLANTEYEKLCGYTRNEIEGRMSWTESVVEEDLEWMLKQHKLRRIDRGKASRSYDFRFRTRYGGIKDIHLTIDMIPGTKTSIASLLDVTERKRAEDALKATSAELQLIFRNMINAFIVWESVFDEKGEYVSFRFGQFNDAYARIAKLKNEEVYGKDVFEVWPSTEKSWVEAFGSVAVSGVPRTFDMYHEPTKGWYHCNAYRPGDSPLQIHVIFEDITERVLQEEERRKLEERLHRAEKMEALGTMAGGVAHDLNNVLGIVVGYSELLLDRLGNEHASLKSLAGEILKGGERAASIVQDLLTLTRRGVTNRQILNLNNIIMDYQASSGIAAILAPHPNTEIRFDLEADLLNIRGSAVHLGKTLTNLVTNALEAMPGGGAVTIKTRSRYLDNPISGYDEVKEGDYVVLSVSDTGEGISDSDIKRIFEPFYTKKTMGRSGTGLGLAIVWGTVKDHHGYINVESVEGKGTIFTLYFPVTREDISREQVPASVSAYMGKGEAILIVDDVREQRELAREMLGKLKYSVASVSGGEEALDYLRRQKADLVILDMILGQSMDGLDVYSEIVKINPQQKAIIVSGYSETERVSRAQAMGAGAYVKKPYTLERLGLAVRNELDGKR